VNDFFVALGKFILEYSFAEGVLKRAAAATCGIETPVGFAIFGAQRIRPIIDTMRRVCESKYETLHPLAQEALVQLAHINDVRDKLLHFGFYRDSDDAYLSSNESIAHVATKIKSIRVTAQDLADMTEDLVVIEMRLLAHCGETKREPDRQARFVQYAQTPFRFKPPQPALPRGKSSRVLQTKKSPPKASPL